MIVENGREKVVCSDHNVVTYEGMDAVGLIMSGQIQAHLNGLYIGFDSSGALSTVATDVNTVAADFHALSSTRDVLRVRLGTHTTDASGVNFSSNRVLVTGAADAGDEGIINGEVLVGGTAKATHFGLIVSSDWSDYSEDKLYAAYTPSSAILVPSNSGVAVRWRPYFTTP